MTKKMKVFGLDESSSALYGDAASKAIIKHHTLLQEYHELDKVLILRHVVIFMDLYISLCFVLIAVIHICFIHICFGPDLIPFYNY